MDIGRFQCGIAALIYHPPSTAYLLLQRSRQDAGQGEWECVTGRVNQGESYEAALHREVREELSVSVQIDFIIGTSHFYRGDTRPENELLAVRYACTLDNRDSIQTSDEHGAFRWLTAAQVDDFLPPEHWLYHTIRRAERMRHTLPAELLAVFRQQGFETG